MSKAVQWDPREAFSARGGLTAEDRYLGFAVLTLLSNWKRWIRRRSERVEFVGDAAVRRSTMVDFVLHEEFVGEPYLEWGERDLHYLPIALLAKHPLTAFRLRDEEDRVIPLLTRSKNAAIATGMLAALAQSIVARALRTAEPRLSMPPELCALRANQIRLPRELEDRFGKMAYLPYRDTGALSPMPAQPDGEATEAHRVYESFVDLLDLSKGRPVEPPERWSWERMSDVEGETPLWTAGAKLSDWAAVLVADPEFRALTHALARNYILCVPVEHEPRTRRVFEYSYQMPITEPLLRDWTKEPAGVIARCLAWLRQQEERLEGGQNLPWAQGQPNTAVGYNQEQIAPLTKLLRGIGWRAKRFAFEAPALGWGGSYHFEVAAPEGIQIRRGVLNTVPIDDKTVQMRVSPGPRNNDRLQLYATEVARGSQGSAEIELKPRSATIVRGAAIAAGLTVGALLLTLIYLPQIQDTNNGALEVTAALLLFMPGLLAVYVARGDEHPMTTSMLYGLRILAGASGMWAVIGAGLILIGPAEDFRLVVWLLAIVAAFATAFVLAVAWRLSAKSRGLEHLLPDPLAATNPDESTMRTFRGTTADAGDTG